MGNWCRALTTCGGGGPSASSLQGPIPVRRCSGLPEKVLLLEIRPGGTFESRPAIYRRFSRFKFDLVPEGRLKIGFAYGRYILFAQRSLRF